MSSASNRQPAPPVGAFFRLQDMSKRITLMAWAAAAFDPAPSLWTLRKMVREGRIDPLPLKVGKSYYVQEDARPVDPSRRPSLVEKLRKAA